MHVIKGINETYPASMPVMRIAEHLAALKAHAYKLTPHEMLITADTVVILDDQVLGKPQDEAEACAMLRSLSGRRHAVVTGVSITTREKACSFSQCTMVEFAHLSEEEISYYVTRFRPFDKAGAYGIQEWIGYIGVKSISGCYYNVMGLPVQRLYEELTKF